MGYLYEAKKNLSAKKREREGAAYLNLVKLRECDDFAEAEATLRSLRFEAARRKTLNEEFGNLKEQILEAETIYKSILQKYGALEADLTPPPLCADCNDNFYLNGAPCRCLLSETKRLYRNSDNRPVDTETEFPTSYPGFTKEDEETNLAAVKYISRWTDAFPTVLKPTLILTGKTGVGKSRLASVVANIINERDGSALFYNAQKLNDLFLRAHLAPLSDKEELLTPVYETDLLIIDDLGTESFLQKVTAEYLYTLLSVRAGKPLIVTTNLSPKNVLERYGERVFSRLFDRASALTFGLVGVDLRLVKR